MRAVCISPALKILRSGLCFRKWMKSPVESKCHFSKSVSADCQSRCQRGIWGMKLKLGVLGTMERKFRLSFCHRYKLPSSRQSEQCFSISPGQPIRSRVSLPRKGRPVGLRNDLFEACSALTHITACTLAGSPKATPYIGGFSYFVTSIAASIASGRSDLAGWNFHPLEKRRLITAHTQSYHTFYNSKSLMLTESRQIVGSGEVRYGRNRTYRNQSKSLPLNAILGFQYRSLPMRRYY